MKISYNWIKRFLKVDLPHDQISEMLTDLGLEVEGVSPFESVRGGLKGVIVGKVLNCIQHPNADRLKVTQVDLGSDKVQIVCGAPNIAKGQKVAVATLGTELYDQNGDAFKIKKSKIRGEESFGMICAQDELGLGASHDGILILDDYFWARYKKLEENPAFAINKFLKKIPNEYKIIRLSKYQLFLRKI